MTRSFLRYMILALVSCSILQLTVFAQTSIKIGDTRDDVIRAFGKPSGTMLQNGSEILVYADGFVELKRGKVVNIDSQLLQPTRQENKDGVHAVQGTNRPEDKAAAVPPKQSAKEKKAAEKKAHSGKDKPSAFSSLVSRIRSVFGASSDACKVYKKFSEHMARNQYGTARSLATGAALNAIPAGAGDDSGRKTGRLASAAANASSAGSLMEAKDDTDSDNSGSVEKVAYSIETDTVSEDGKSATVVAVQTVYRTGSGSVASPASSRQRAELTRVGGAWKVSVFENQATGK